MKITCSLSEFATRTQMLHGGYQNPKNSRPVAGVKRTRLMIRMRPNDSQKPLVLKATDGNVTISARVQYPEEWTLLDQILTNFITSCTTKATSQ